MQLDYTTRKELDIPEDAFEDGLATLILQGGLYGGDWTINACTTLARSPNAPCGTLATFNVKHPDLPDDPRYPHLAVESMFIWLRQQTMEQGLRVVLFENLNGLYGPNEAKFFCAAQAVIAGPTFVPPAGVVYADEQTLDQVMASR